MEKGISKTNFTFFWGYIKQLLGNKVDKVSGKQLSTNDYTTTEKNKLAGIAENANNYVHPSSHAASIITQDSSHRFVSDTEKSTWNDKAGKSVATTAADGLMSSEDKAKLNSIAEGANKTSVVNNLTSTSTTSALSAAQGKELKRQIDEIKAAMIDINGGYPSSVAEFSLDGGEI